MVKKMASWKVGVIAAAALVAIMFVASPVSSRKVRGDNSASLIPEQLQAAFLQSGKSSIPIEALEGGMREPLKLAMCKELVLGNTWDVGRTVKVTGRGWRNKRAPVTVSIFGEKPQTEKNREAANPEDSDDKSSSGTVEKSDHPLKSYEKVAAEDVKTAQEQSLDHSGDSVPVQAFLSLSTLARGGADGSDGKTLLSGDDSDKASESAGDPIHGDPEGEKETDNGWSPLLQVVIERSPDAEHFDHSSSQELTVDAEVSTAGFVPLPSQGGHIDDILEREKFEDFFITGPFTCSVFTMASSGEKQNESTEKTPMISDEAGFMIIFTRSLDGYETTVYGWEKTEWKVVHLDNVAVVGGVEPKMISLDQNASVNTLRYYVSSSMTVDLSSCKDPRSGRNDDCKLSNWTDWTSCSTTCGKGEQHRMRSVTKEATGSGSCDSPLTEFKMCNLDHPCS